MASKYQDLKWTTHIASVAKKRPIRPWAFSEETSNTVHNLHFTGSINNGVWRNNMGPLHGNKHQ